jgi:hypothetical protein
MHGLAPNSSLPNFGPVKAAVAAGEISLSDFYAYIPMHKYIHVPSLEMWPVVSVNSRLAPVVILDANGQPIIEKGEPKTIAAALWLDKHQPVEQMTWAPGLPMIIKDKLILDGGWVEHIGAAVFNLYRPPEQLAGDPAKAGPWIDHIRYIYPNEWEHIINWLAHRVQRPQEKINHALVLGGSQGIGKDSMLEPIKYAIGPWNFQETSPGQMLTTRFNGYLKGVVLRISEARDVGEYDRFKFYDHMKIITAAPPDTLRVDEKNLREHKIVNVCGIIYTTNHKTDGIYLASDDRRHYVAWSDRRKEDQEFQGDYWNKLWNFYEKQDGIAHVAAYLRERDISGFDPKAPPPKTAAWWAIVDSNRPAEEAELADAIDQLGNPDALTLERIINALRGFSNMIIPPDDASLLAWLSDRKNRRQIPYRLERCGYVPVRNPAASDGHWKIKGKRQAAYAKASLPLSQQLQAAQGL